MENHRLSYVYPTLQTVFSQTIPNLFTHGIVTSTRRDVISGCVRRIILQTVRMGVGQDLFQQGVSTIEPKEERSGKTR